MAVNNTSRDNWYRTQRDNWYLELPPKLLSSSAISKLLSSSAISNLSSLSAIFFFIFPLIAISCNADPILRIKPPRGSLHRKVRWMRRAFYRIYLIEKNKRDGGDRLRKFIIRYSKLAQLTYQYNRRYLESRRLEGKKFNAWDKYLLAMNIFIRLTLHFPKKDKIKKTRER